jgi:hypothetical protein
LHAKAIKPGDRFRKTDSVYQTVWVVTRVIRAPGVPTHFMLTDTEGRNDVRTISEPTLVDPNFYSPLPPAAPPEGGSGTNGDLGRRDHAARSQAAPAPDRAADRSRNGRSDWLDDLGLPGVPASGPSRVR